jgi:hypothetical protein
VGSDKPKKPSISKGVERKAGDALEAMKAARGAPAPDVAPTAGAPGPGDGAKAASAAVAGKAAKAAPREPAAPRPRRGFALFGLIVGLIAGVLAYAVTELWIDPVYRPIGGQAFLVFIGAAGAALLLTASPERWLRGLPHALATGALIAGPTAYMLAANIETRNLSSFPPMFWFLVGAPATGLLLIALSRAALAPQGKRYTELFASGVTLPLIAVGATLFALLGAVLLFSWAALMRSMNVNLFHQVFQQPWFMLPFLGAIAGLSIGLIKSLEPVLGALRFVTLLFARIAMPLTAVFSVAFLGVLLLKGPDALFAAGYAAPALLGLALVGMLIFNGVYQNGEGGPPPGWLRLSTIAALLAFPAYAGLAVFLFAVRISELGLTPARFAGVVLSGLAALYSVVGLAGVLTEFRWKSERWMPVVAPMNAGMAMLWALALIVTATPLVNSWAWSARHQEKLVLSGRANVDTFDYGYLRFALGDAGAAALNRLAQTTAHPKADAIRAGAGRALAAPTYSLYRNPPPPPQPVRDAPPEPPAAPERKGVDALDFNPKNEDTAAEDN